MDTTPNSVDAQGVERGACSACGQCSEYIRPINGYNCDYCGCKPAMHENLSSPQSPNQHTSPQQSKGWFGSVFGKSEPSPKSNLPNCRYPGCTKSVFVESSGKVHDYCGITHAKMDLSQNNNHQSNSNNGTSNAPSQNGSTCQYQGCTKPVFVEPSGKIHNYCGRTHAHQAMTQKSANTTTYPTSNPANNNNTCQYPGCSKSVYVDPSGKVHSYCSKTHAKGHQSVQAQQTPGITFLAKSDPKYQEISTQFMTKWLHAKPKPTIQSIAKISCDSNVTTKYENYKQGIIQKRPEYATGGHKHGGPGNEHRRFHGTNTMKCSLGLNGNSTLCGNSGCATCSIIKEGFQIKYKSKYGRFGDGIYLTSTSSKSDDYNGGTSSGLGSGNKAMFVCKVVVGKGKKLLHDDPSLKAAPSGYDSVLGETGGVLNYDEVIVYHDDAVIPAYLIIYSS